MKGYYKNWYQHYLEIEAQKEQDLKKGYYSNLPLKEIESKTNEPKGTYIREEKQESVELQPIQPRLVKKKKKKFRLIGMLLPISTLAGFIFLWYQMDIGPTRQWVNEALVFARIREPEQAIDIVSYHRNLLNQHHAFIEKMTQYLAGDQEMDFEHLSVLYDELRLNHSHVVEITDETHAEAIRIWSLKAFGVHQVMNELKVDVDIEETYPAFIKEQLELAELIRSELEIELN